MKLFLLDADSGSVVFLAPRPAPLLYEVRLDAEVPAARRFRGGELAVRRRRRQVLRRPAPASKTQPSAASPSMVLRHPLDLSFLPSFISLTLLDISLFLCFSSSLERRHRKAQVEAALGERWAAAMGLMQKGAAPWGFIAPRLGFQGELLQVERLVFFGVRAMGHADGIRAVAWGSRGPAASKARR
ncbi:unnamed protein product, partial [Urochloa humidicola]